MQRPAGLRLNQWHVAPVVPAAIRQELPTLPPVLLQLLYNRGLTRPGEIQAFLDGRYLLSTDPFLLPDMDKAVARIEQAIRNEERVIVYGDFDADGVTSTVLLTEALRGFGLSREQAQPYIPDRIDEGYGLNEEALTKLKEEKGADLVISVDCGIRSVREVAHACAIGLDMIVTDHHTIGPELPPAIAVVNPKRPDSAYPDAMLAGVGIAYKVAQALYQTMPQRAHFELESLLDLVAIGTVADLAPLLKENRQLVIEGLKVLNTARRPGVAALAKVARVSAGNMTAETIGFGLGPRINAAGRLRHAYMAAKLLTTQSQAVADQLARDLDEVNRERQSLTSSLTAKAEEMVDAEALIQIAAGKDFAPGVVGLVASRLAEKNYRPAIVFEQGEAESRASCRSIPEFHITEALDETADLLVRYGGHAQAAGLTIRNENMEAFIAQMTTIAEAQLGELALQPKISVDAEIDLEAVDWALYENLAQLEPTGYANATPVFVSRGVKALFPRAVGQNGAHLQLRLASPYNESHDNLGAIAFRQGEWANCLPEYVDVVYTIGVNEWRGRRDLQLMVQDLRPAARVI
ncbi:MAG: single-stranded-DNA-specific exonuclease RecJ [Ardenticatenaceae bacterium]|nr:single-stranded-DNA-specific exonuclease RecJ [Ardenticatenaceae bacterium]